jgi:hypothetical protein
MFEFCGIPGVPVGDGDEGAVEVDLVHHLGTVLGVCPIPEKTALFDDHFESFLFLRQKNIENRNR